MITVSVQVPQGATGGSTIQIIDPTSGRPFQVQVPAGLNPGDTFNVDVLQSFPHTILPSSLLSLGRPSYKASLLVVLIKATVGRNNNHYCCIARGHSVSTCRHHSTQAPPQTVIINSGPAQSPSAADAAGSAACCAWCASRIPLSRLVALQRSFVRYASMLCPRSGMWLVPFDSIRLLLSSPHSRQRLPRHYRFSVH